MIKKGDEVSLDILELNSEGRGVSKLEDGFVIFSAGTLPGDRALVKISKKKSSYAEAKLVEIIKSSEFRLEPECSHFGVCGGCKIQNYVYEKQVEYKVNVVKNALERIGGFRGLSISEAVKADKRFFYRNKMEFSFSDDEWMTEKDTEEVKEKFALGLHVPKFHSKIINIEKCFLQSELSNNVLNFSRDFFKSRGISVYSTKTQTGFLRFLIIRQSANTKDFMVNLITFEHHESLMKEYKDLLIKNFPGITTIINSISDKKAQVATGEKEYVLHGKGYIFEKLKDPNGRLFEFKISPQSFFQTNTFQAENLFNVVTEFGDFNNEDNVLDLYCGAGTISIFISDIAGKVLGVELIEDAIKDANINKEINRSDNTDFICSDIKDFLMENETVKNYNKLILDPPRSGLHPKICEILSATDFERIIYVSCNPHTQARDLQLICGGEKYKIEKIRPVDMFPHTYHIENVISLIKNNQKMTLDSF